MVDPVNHVESAGFDESFIGADVPLPKLVAGAKRLDPGGGGAGDPILRYEHFSIAMSPGRKLAYFVAVNIDGSRTIDVGPRGDDKWIFDTRIPEDQQMGNWLYDNNDFDKGHLVRRLDPVWGDSREEAVRAEADTFHFTNCAPQHWRFNRRREFWQGIETYILGNTEVYDLRISLFTGPVLADDDPPMEGTLVPRDYWKWSRCARRTARWQPPRTCSHKPSCSRRCPRSSSSASTRRSRCVSRRSRSGRG
jgi:endonuclease G, mitochondrial